MHVVIAAEGQGRARVRAVPRGASPVPRWTWERTGRWYPGLLADGVRVERAHDLELVDRLLDPAAPREPAPEPPPLHAPGVDDAAPPTLFDAAPPTLFDAAPHERRGSPGRAAPEEPDLGALVGRLDGQLAVLARDPRLALLAAAESAGALAAAEMHHTGVPWDAEVHDALLREHLGPRPRLGERPAAMAALAEQVRAALDAPALNPDSPPELLRALRRTGLPVASTRSWDLRRVDHPAIEPLLHYKKLARLHSANGWAWLDQWVASGRFRPTYVVGGVVTGRWSSVGGGALQLPHQVRGAVRADPGWSFVVADAAQLEPRVLAGLAHDERLAAAGHGADLYQGMVDAGVVPTRQLAKVGVLGAMYGGTTGASGAVLPRLRRAFPGAVGLVEEAARTGEAGGEVRTLLGRRSPRPGSAWAQAQGDALDDAVTAAQESRARAQTRAWGRFTRNFVVQGTAAEWALCWLAELRRRLWALGEAPVPDAGRAPAPFTRRPHLVYFLHDEVVVHTPTALAGAVEQVVVEAAQAAGRLLFGAFPVEFPLSVATAACYGDAKA